MPIPEYTLPTVLAREGIDQQGSRVTLIGAGSNTDLAIPAKALRVFVPDGTANPTVTIIGAGDPGDPGTPVPLNLSPGVNWEPILVRRITAFTAGLQVIAVHD